MAHRLVIPRDDLAEPDHLDGPPDAVAAQIGTASAWVAAVFSFLALIVLAGFPAAGTAAGEAVRVLVLGSFWLGAPGAVLVARLRLAPLTGLALVPLLGLAILTALGAAGAWTGIWVPRASTAVVAAVTLALAVRSIRRQSGVPVLRSRAGGPTSRPTRVLAGALVVAVMSWAVSIPGVSRAGDSVFGLIVAGPLTLPVALAIAVVVALVAMRRQLPWFVVGSAAVVLLVLRTTASVSHEVPIAAWTYKHIGVVEVLQEKQQVLGGTDIYMNWPAMFGAAAWFADASGVAAIDLARWVTPVVHVVIASSTAALARVYGASATGSAAAGLLVVLLNWVGQDYFAPQALAMCLAAGFLLLLAQSRTSRSCALLALLLYSVIVPTHQLTPYWLLALAGALVVLRRAPWWLGAGMAFLALGYLALHYEVAASYGLFGEVDPVANVQGNVPDVPALGRDVGGYVAQAAALLMWTSTLAVLVSSIRSRGLLHSMTVVPAAMAFSPFVLLLAQSYGGEAVLRVTLYSTVGCAAVLGPALADLLRRTRTLAAGAATWLAVTTAVVAQASWGAWSVNVMDPGDVALSQQLSDGAIVVTMNGNWPGRLWTDYERFATSAGGDVSLLAALRADASPEARSTSVTPTLERLEALVTAVEEPGPAYLVATRSMRAYDDYYAGFTDGGYQEFLDEVRRSPDWTEVAHVGDSWTFRYQPDASAGG